MSARRGWRLTVDGLLLFLLAAYFWAGRDLVPFHGDESSHIFMSRDYYYLVKQGDINRLRFSRSPANRDEQQFRLLNGAVHRLAMGLAWDAAGVEAPELNRTWDWTSGWSKNVAASRLPGPRLLAAARTSSVIFTIAAGLLLYLLAYQVSQSRMGAVGAAVFFFLDPIVLINGRRAMGEGAMLFSLALLLIAGVATASALERGAGRTRQGVLLLGAAGGFALAGKHSSAVTLAAILAAVLWGAVAAWRTKGGGNIMASLGRVMGVIVTAAAVFAGLNPIWWHDPREVAKEAFIARRELMSAQAAAYGGKPGVADRLLEAPRSFISWRRQYYEDPFWAGYGEIKRQIDAYEKSFLRGWPGGPVKGAVVAVLGLAGIAYLLANMRFGWARVILASLAMNGAAAAAGPLPWERYYLPLILLAALAVGLGLALLESWAGSLVSRVRQIAA